MGVEKIIAFEPSPPNIACLKRNMALEIAAGNFILI